MPQLLIACTRWQPVQSRMGHCQTTPAEQPDALSPPLCKMWYKARLASFAVDIHTDRSSSAGLAVLHKTCWVCDTVFWAAIHSNSIQKSGWLLLGHKARFLRCLFCTFRSAPNPSVYQIHWICCGQNWNHGSKCVQNLFIEIWTLCTHAWTLICLSQRWEQ